MSESRPGIASRMAGQPGLLMLGNMFTLFVGFPFQIYLAKTLGADQLGAFGLFEVIARTAGTVFGFGLATTLVRFIPHHLALRESGSVRKLLGAVFWRASFFIRLVRRRSVSLRAVNQYWKSCQLKNSDVLSICIPEHLYI